MTELSGALDGPGLPALVRFLASLRMTGWLGVVHDDWRGELFFESGRLVSASLGSRTGMPAIEALVQALPGGQFTFATSTESPPASARNVDLGPDELQAHLDNLAARAVQGAPSLPSLLAVPVLVAHEDTRQPDQLRLTRGTLQTLLLVDGRRPVRDIVSARASFEVLWQLAALAELGVVRLAAGSDEVIRSTVAAAAASGSLAPPGIRSVAPRPTGFSSASPPTPISSPTLGFPPLPSAPVHDRQAVVHCPKLGFEEDPSRAFGRPTRLHRCFALGAPLSLPMDQQRELCLTDHFETCPRLGLTAPDAVDDTRLVRIRGDASDAIARLGVDVARFGRDVGTGLQRLIDPARPPAAEESHGRIARLTRVLQALPGVERAAPIEVAEPVGAASVSGDHGPSAQAGAALTLAELMAAGRRLALLGGLAPRLPTIGVIAMAVVLVGLLLVPRLLENSEDAPPPVVISAARQNAASDAARPQANANAPAAGATDAGALAAQAPPTRQPGAAASSTAANSLAADGATPAVAASANPAVAGRSAAENAMVLASGGSGFGPRVLIDERFADNERGWLDDPRGPATLTSGTYRLTTRQPGQFVAIGAPLTTVPRDVVVGASFHKLGGPAAGGYGIIVRDQGPDVRDGASQTGRYYVLEVSDKGEVGIWRRENDRWVDLLPWQHSDVVRAGTAVNEVVVRAVGDQLTLQVNGTEVGGRVDSTLNAGRIGLFVGGDLNQIAVDRFWAQAL